MDIRASRMWALLGAILRTCPSTTPLRPVQGPSKIAHGTLLTLHGISTTDGPDFQSCLSWASTPRTAAALTAKTELVDSILPCTLNGTEVQLVIPSQTAIRGGMSQVLKGYASFSDTVRVFAVKICQGSEVCLLFIACVSLMSLRQ